MRTTLTLDPDVADLVEEAMHRERRPMKQIVNDALRQALRPARQRKAPFRVVPHEAVLQPGIDWARLNQLADELEDEAILAKAARDT